MTALAPHLARFLREHLPCDQRASPHTCDAYAYSFQILVAFAAQRLRMRPSQLEIEQLDVPLILAFLEHIERDRGNKARSRNARLAAVRSFFRFLEYRVPACLDQALRVRAIPMKKTDEALVASLTRSEIQVLLDAPDPRSISGVRDRAMLHLAFAAGLRVSELVGLRVDQFTVEGDDGRSQGMARGSPAWPRSRTVPQWCRSRDDPIGIRVHPRQACRHRGPHASVDREQAGDPARSSPQLRNAHAPGDARCPQGCAVARPCQPSEHRSLSTGRSDGEARGAQCDERTAPEAGPVPASGQAHRHAEGQPQVIIMRSKARQKPRRRLIRRRGLSIILHSA